MSNVHPRDTEANAQTLTAPSFTRVETFGNPSTHWVKMTVDPMSAELVSFEAKLVTANLETKST